MGNSTIVVYFLYKESYLSIDVVARVGLTGKRIRIPYKRLVPLFLFSLL